jgi:hypothetical protein
MTYLAAMNAQRPAPGRTAMPALLYKSDHPRRIDAYIDFFGDGLPRQATADCCEVWLLESLA